MITDIVSHSPANKQTTYHPFTVFLVDDDPDDIALTRRILKLFPQVVNIVCLTKPGDLFHELERRRLFSNSMADDFRSLILLDIHMPEIDGIALLDQLKSSPYTENIPVVMLSGDYHTDNIEKTYHMNADAFIVKPLSINHLDYFQAILNGDNKRKEIF